MKSDAQIRPQQYRCQPRTSEGGHKLLTVFFVKTVAKTLIQPLCQYTMKGRFQNFPHGFTGENICHVGRLEFSSFSCLSTMGPCWGWQPNPIDSSTWTYDIQQWIPLNLEHLNYSKSVCPSYLCSEGCWKSSWSILEQAFNCFKGNFQISSAFVCVCRCPSLEQSYIIDTLPKTSISPLKIYLPKRKALSSNYHFSVSRC